MTTPDRPDRGARFVVDLDEAGIDGAVIVRPEDQVDPGEDARER